jgi:2-desacetyl-2-hydroxyethyl bacteriochlorophyllide A dehydrogenase
MKAAVIQAVDHVTVETIDDPMPKGGQIIVEVEACGICGTDLHILQGEFAPSLPIVPGHEFAGVIVELGPEISAIHRLAVGDRVAVDPSLYCHECRYCRSGRGNLCEQWGAVGVTVPGGAAEYVAVPAANCVKLPDHIDTADAALIEPLACAVRGYDVLTKTQLGAHILIYGAGTMGLIMLQLAQRVGAAAVDVVDVNAKRLDAARSLAASRAAMGADELDRPDGWDLVVDATGNAKAIQDGLARVAKGGTFLQFGVADYAARATFEPYKIYNQEITITGSMAILNGYERAADLFAAGVLDSRQLITDRFPLADYPRALEHFRTGEGLKTQVRAK